MCVDPTNCDGGCTECATERTERLVAQAGGALLASAELLLVEPPDIKGAMFQALAALGDMQKLPGGRDARDALRREAEAELDRRKAARHG